MLGCVTNRNVQEIPDQAEHIFKSTSHVDFSGNKLTYLPQFIGILLSVDPVVLYNIPCYIGTCTNVTRLNFSNNQLTSLPANLSDLDQLESLNVE